jgi:hypothetical protein
MEICRRLMGHLPKGLYANMEIARGGGMAKWKFAGISL